MTKSRFPTLNQISYVTSLCLLQKTRTSCPQTALPFTPPCLQRLQTSPACVPALPNLPTLPCYTGMFALHIFSGASAVLILAHCEQLAVVGRHWAVLLSASIGGQSDQISSTAMQAGYCELQHFIVQSGSHCTTLHCLCWPDEHWPDCSL